MQLPAPLTPIDATATYARVRSDRVPFYCRGCCAMVFPGLRDGKPIWMLLQVGGGPVAEHPERRCPEPELAYFDG